MPTPIYALDSQVSTTSYDTEVKLFDTPKTFTILCEANANVYNFDTGSTMFGLGTGNTFAVGRRYGIKKVVAGEATGNNTDYYCGFMCNYSGDSITNKARSVYGRGENKKSIRRIAVTYDHTSRKVNVFSTGYSNMSAPNDAWWTLSGDISSETTIKLNINTLTNCIVNHFNIYDTILSDTQINEFLEGGLD